MARRDVISAGDVFDPEREARRLAGAKAEADRLAKRDPGKAEKRLSKATRRAKGALVQAVTDAAKHGAVAPLIDQAVKHRWRLELIQAPKGSEAPAAYVVRFDGNSPIARLSRQTAGSEAPVLSVTHVRAAERLCALHAAAVRQPRVTASYDGAVSGGGGGGPFVDVHGAAWAKLQVGLAALLPVEREVVIDVVLWERPIAELARRRALTGVRNDERAQGAVTQTLRLGLERLSFAWGLDAPPPRGG